MFYALADFAHFAQLVNAENGIVGNMRAIADTYREDKSAHFYLCASADKSHP